MPLEGKHMKTFTTAWTRDCYDICSLRVTVNDSGKIVSISARVPENVLWAPRQSEDPERNPQNGLMRSIPQEIGNGPRFNSTRVNIVKEGIDNE